MAPRARFELATLRLTAGECKTLNALFGVAYDGEHLKSRPSVGQLLGNLLKRRTAVGSKRSKWTFIIKCANIISKKAFFLTLWLFPMELL